MTREIRRPHLNARTINGAVTVPSTLQTATRYIHTEVRRENSIELQPMSEDGAHEPLIRTVSPRPEEPAEDAYNTAERARQDEERSFQVPGIFIWILTFCAGVSGLLFGYE